MPPADPPSGGGGRRRRRRRRRGAAVHALTADGVAAASVRRGAHIVEIGIDRDRVGDGAGAARGRWGASNPYDYGKRLRLL